MVERLHALLSASSSHRWLECPPSARLEEHGADSNSTASAEGTLAHEIAELTLKAKLGIINKNEYVKLIKKLSTDAHFSEEMLNHANEYAEYCYLRRQELISSEYIRLEIESKVDYSHVAEDGFGTCDCVIYSSEKVIVIDYKYGKGVEVSAENNPQLMLYAIGANASNPFVEPQKVEMVIFQPRIKSEPDSWEIDISELNLFEDRVKEIAPLAFEGKGTRKAGEHCRFCKVKATCLARLHKFIVPAASSQSLDISPSQLGALIPLAKLAEKWGKDLQELALKLALDGETIEGYKLVEGRSNRTYADETEVIEKLKGKGYREAVLFTRDLLTVAKMEKMLGKKEFNSLVGEFVEKSAGKPTLVPNDDKRPALQNNIINTFDILDKEEN